MRKRLSHLFVPVLLVLCLSGESLTFRDSENKAFDPEKKYAVDELKEDFTLLRTALEEAHAGLYYYTPKEEMDSLFSRLFAGLDHPQQLLPAHVCMRVGPSKIVTFEQAYDFLQEGELLQGCENPVYQRCWEAASPDTFAAQIELTH